jgi:hypothetical protein
VDHRKKGKPGAIKNTKEKGKKKFG